MRRVGEPLGFDTPEEAISIIICTADEYETLYADYEAASNEDLAAGLDAAPSADSETWTAVYLTLAGAATCTEAIGPKRGADAIYEIVGKGDKRKLKFRSYFKIPRINTETENCVAHNGSLIPVEGRDIMVQAWYQGGISVWDFTNSRNPVEIAYWERGPLSAERLVLGGSWSAYWHNGFIYSNDIQKGLDVLELTDRRTDAAKSYRTWQNNAQTQKSFSY